MVAEPAGGVGRPAVLAAFPGRGGTRSHTAPRSPHLRPGRGCGCGVPRCPHCCPLLLGLWGHPGVSRDLPGSGGRRHGQARPEEDHRSPGSLPRRRRSRASMVPAAPSCRPDWPRAGPPSQTPEPDLPVTLESRARSLVRKALCRPGLHPGFAIRLLVCPSRPSWVLVVALQACVPVKVATARSEGTSRRESRLTRGWAVGPESRAPARPTPAAHSVPLPGSRGLVLGDPPPLCGGGIAP